MPPSVRDYNQTSFWDFIESLQEQGPTHPFFESMNNATNNNTDDRDGARDAHDQHQAANPWSQGWGGFPFGPMPHRGRHGHHGRGPGGPHGPGPHGSPPPSEQGHGRHGPGGPRGPGSRGPPPPGHEHAWHGPGGPHGPGPHGPPSLGHEHAWHGHGGPHGPGPRGPPPHGHEHDWHGPHGANARGSPPPSGHEHDRKHGRRGSPPPPDHEHAGSSDNDLNPTSENDNDPEEVVLGDDGLPQENEPTPDARGPGGRHHGRRGHGGPRHGGHGGPHHAGHEGPRGGGRGRGGWGGRGRGGPFGHCGFDNSMVGGFGALASLFQDQLFGGEANSSTDKKEKSEEDFKPEVDVFDTTDSFIVHISLPGAKKDDVGVHWDAEKSELNVAGVIHRPGDEDFLKTLALDERKVGAFARKVRLGSRAHPAQVDVDGISAKLEDGILRVDVPKLDSGYVEIKKVDIE